MTESRKNWYAHLREGQKLLPLRTKVYYWSFRAWEIVSDKILGVYANRHETTYLTEHDTFDASKLGLTVFVTREEAEEVYNEQGAKEAKPIVHRPS